MTRRRTPRLTLRPLHFVAYTSSNRFVRARAPIYTYARTARYQYRIIPQFQSRNQALAVFPEPLSAPARRPQRSDVASPDTAVCVSSGCFAVARLFYPRLDCVRSAFCPKLTPSSRFATLHSMKMLLPTGSSGRGPVPPEKRFLITLITCL